MAKRKNQMIDPTAEEIQGYVNAARYAWRSALLGAGLGVGLAWVYTTVIPPTYLAQSTLLVNVPEAERLSAMTESLSPVMILSGVARSNQTAQAVATHTGLPRHHVMGSLVVEADVMKSQLILSAQHGDRAKALGIVSAALQEMKRLARDVDYSVASKQAVALSKAIELRQKDLAEAERRVLEFQKAMTTVSDPTDLTASAEYATTLKTLEMELGATERALASAKSALSSASKYPASIGDLPTLQPIKQALLDKEAKVLAARKSLTPTNPDRMRLESELQAARESYEQEVANALRSSELGLSSTVITLEAKRVTLQWQRDFWRTQTANAPEEAMILVRLTGEVIALEVTLRHLTAQLEEVNLRQAVDRFSWTSLSAPEILPIPINKNYSLNLVLGGMLGLLLVGGFTTWRLESRPARSTPPTAP